MLVGEGSSKSIDNFFDFWWIPLNCFQTTNLIFTSFLFSKTWELNTLIMWFEYKQDRWWAFWESMGMNMEQYFRFCWTSPAKRSILSPSWLWRTWCYTKACANPFPLFRHQHCIYVETPSEKNQHQISTHFLCGTKAIHQFQPNMFFNT